MSELTKDETGVASAPADITHLLWSAEGNDVLGLWDFWSPVRAWRRLFRLETSIRAAVIARIHNEALIDVYALGRKSVQETTPILKERTLGEAGDAVEALKWEAAGCCVIADVGKRSFVMINGRGASEIVKAHNVAIDKAMKLTEEILLTPKDATGPVEEGLSLLEMVREIYEATFADRLSSPKFTADPDIVIEPKTTLHVEQRAPADDKVPLSVNKSFDKMTDAELRENYGYWRLKIDKATGWGAAVAFAQNCERRIKVEMQRRGL